MRTFTLSILCVCSLLVSGCSNDAPETTTTAAEVVSETAMKSTDLSEFAGDWRLVSLGDGETLTAEMAPTIRFDGDMVSGKAACNNYSGGKSTDPSKPNLFGPMAATRMMCPEPQMSIENAYLQVLAQVQEARAQDGRLILSWKTGDASGSIEFEPISADEQDS